MSEADSPLTWDHPTVRLKQGEMTLVQSLGTPGVRQPCLVQYSGEAPGQRFVLPEGTLSLGRAPECTVQLDSPGVSRRHAELRVQGETVHFNDAGSVNGSWVNDRRVRAPVPLKDGDLLRLGELLLKFYGRDSVDALLHDRIYRMATVDAGTEVFTKRYVMDTLAREMRRARRQLRPLSVLCIDLDHFKSVNDRWGHNAGDAVLREAASAAHAALRGTDVLGRCGGEEFLAVLPDTGLDEARGLAERVRAALAARPITLRAEDGAELRHVQTASIGVAVCTPALTTPRDLLGEADARMYEAKRNGRNRVAG